MAAQVVNPAFAASVGTEPVTDIPLPQAIPDGGAAGTTWTFKVAVGEARARADPSSANKK